MLQISELVLKKNNFKLSVQHLEIEKGAYFVLLGESGSGKSMLLETIAGLNQPQQGSILYNQQPIHTLKIQQRPVSILFQDFALFPHYTVEGNLAYPLKSRKNKNRQIKKTIHEISQQLGIGNLLHRQISELSGGEKQRVALARALIVKPQILLLDEPLSLVDAGRRAEIQFIMRQIHQSGQTIVHVTHHFEEALALATHVGIISNGQIIQTGKPEEVFRNPKSKFAAQLTGEHNFFECSWQQLPNSDLKTAMAGKLKIMFFTSSNISKGFLLIPHKNIIVSPKPDSVNTLNHFQGTIKDIFASKFGKEMIVDIGTELYVAVSNELIEKSDFKRGDNVWVSFKASSVKFFPVY